MSDIDKMREALLAAKKIIANPHGYTETSVLVAEALIGLAAQSVPVVGEVAATVSFSGDKGDLFAVCVDETLPIGTQLFLQHTHSIAAAELERLRKDAERYHYLRKMGLREAGFKENKITFSAQDEAIDAAIAAEENSHE